jgi:hypothetical protein
MSLPEGPLSLFLTFSYSSLVVLHVVLLIQGLHLLQLETLMFYHGKSMVLKTAVKKPHVSKVGEIFLSRLYIEEKKID